MHTQQELESRSTCWVSRGDIQIRVDSTLRFPLLPHSLPLPAAPREKKVLPNGDHFQPFTLAKFPRCDGEAIACPLKAPVIEIIE